MTIFFTSPNLYPEGDREQVLLFRKWWQSAGMVSICQMRTRIEYGFHR